MMAVFSFHRKAVSNHKSLGGIFCMVLAVLVVSFGWEWTLERSSVGKPSCLLSFYSILLLLAFVCSCTAYATYSCLWQRSVSWPRSAILIHNSFWFLFKCFCPYYTCKSHIYCEVNHILFLREPLGRKYFMVLTLGEVLANAVIKS